MSSTKLILIVDDDPAIQDALQAALEDEGYAVALAANGEEALRKLREGCHPDAIVLDHMMPVMDGPAFAAEVRKDTALKGVPIILVTADGRASQKASEIGLKSSLRKPLKIVDLLVTLEAAVQAPGANGVR